MSRVLHLLKSSNFSGAENVALNIIRIVDGFDYVYVCPKGDIKDTLIDENVNYSLMEKFTFKNIYQILKSENPQIIHAHDVTASIYAAILSIFLPKIRVISHLHSNDPRMTKLSVRLFTYSLCLPFFDSILVVSETVKNEFKFKKIIQRAVVLPNVIDATMIVEKAKQDVPDYFDIVIVGRLTDLKDPLRTLEILKDVTKSIPKVKVAFIGEGPMKDEMLDKINKENLSENISLIGFKKNPYSFIRNSKCLLLLSKYEGFGLVVLESLILGTPVVATPVGGIPNLLRYGGGVLSQDNDVLIKELIRIVSEDEYRNERQIEALNAGLKLNNESIFKEKLLNEYLK